MSYSGFTERLCVKGHYSSYDVWCDQPERCDCGEAFRFTHGVDQTNGYDESYPGSCCAPKVQIGTEDEWHVDPYCNRYARITPLFEPNGDGIWIRVNSRGHACPPYEDDLASVDTHPKDGDSTKIEAPLVSGAVTNEVRQTPTPHPSNQREPKEA